MSNKVKYNLKNVHAAKLTESVVDGVTSFSYDTPKAIPGAVSISLDAEGDSSPFYADGIVYFRTSSNNGYSGDLEMALIPEWFRTEILREKLDNKGVLVEKAFGANAAQTREMLAVAKETGMLCAEAIWTRYMPSRAIIDKILASGAIGEIQAIDANLCYPTTAKARITDPALAGGALLDVGVYPINFIDMIMHNAPIARIESSMRAYETGVDAHNSMTFYYENGVMATAQSSILCHSDRTGSVWGTDGYMVCQNINNVEAIDVYDGNHTVVAHYDVPAQLTGYEYEVAAAAQAVIDGRTECEEMPHADTLRIMELMDSLRRDWNLTYPFER